MGGREGGTEGRVGWERRGVLRETRGEDMKERGKKKDKC